MFPGTKIIVAIGPAGSDFSTDDGQTWKPVDGPGFDTFHFVKEKRLVGLRKKVR